MNVETALDYMNDATLKAYCECVQNCIDAPINPYLAEAKELREIIRKHINDSCVIFKQSKTEMLAVFGYEVTG